MQDDQKSPRCQSRGMMGTHGNGHGAGYRSGVSLDKSGGWSRLHIKYNIICWFEHFIFRICRYVYDQITVEVFTFEALRLQ